MWMSCGRPTLQQLGVFKPAPPLKTAFYSITKVKDPLIKDQSEHRTRWGHQDFIFVCGGTYTKCSLADLCNLNQFNGPL